MEEQQEAVEVEESSSAVEVEIDHMFVHACLYVGSKRCMYK